MLLGVGGCGVTDAGPPVSSPDEGWLRARPGGAGKHGSKDAEAGLRSLEAPGSARPALLYVPPGYSPGRAAPLIVLLHGAGSGPRAGLAPLIHQADEAGALLLAPKSELGTWDAILGRRGSDVATINALLGRVFSDFNVDPAGVAIGGFSDGASYALSLGLANGGLFRRVLAFSPGFVPEHERRGRPAIYVSHGNGDEVLPVERCSRHIVPSLRKAGYDVRYREFDGGHVVPREVARDAIRWMLAPAREHPA